MNAPINKIFKNKLHILGMPMNKLRNWLIIMWFAMHHNMAEVTTTALSNVHTGDECFPAFMWAYSRTPISRCPSSIAIDNAVLPSCIAHSNDVQYQCITIRVVLNSYFSLFSWIQILRFTVWFSSPTVTVTASNWIWMSLNTALFLGTMLMTLHC